MTERVSTVPLDQIARAIAPLVADFERDQRSLSFTGVFGRTRLQVRPVDHTARDGSRISEVVTIHTDLPDEVTLADLGREQGLSGLNTLASTSALMHMARGGALASQGVTRLVSRLSVFDGDDEAWQLYAPLLSFTAVFQADFMSRTFRGVADPEGDPGFEPLYLADEPSRWGAVEFERAQDLIHRMGLFGNSGADGLACEFPWDAGATSQLVHLSRGEQKQTSLLTLSTREAHPVLGNGLLCRLALPVTYGPGKAVEAACRLNLLELLATDAPPFFGAWCVDSDTGHLTFVNFWPNFFHRPGTASNLLIWMLARTEVAKRWVETDSHLRVLGVEDTREEFY